MSFDWVGFFQRYNIEYVEAGPNVAREHVNIACPFCREDPSHHLGVSLHGKGWGCWRDETHRGKRPERLIVALLRCSWVEAKAYVEAGVAPVTSLDALRAKLERQDAVPQTWPGPQPQRFFPELFKLSRRSRLSRPFLRYLNEERGFGADAPTLAKRYKLRGSVLGPFKQRLILPIYTNGILVGWTGRAIMPAKLRYKAHPPGDQLSSFLFNHDQALAGGRVLVICEGPMDALKVDFYGKPAGVRAVALMGLWLPPARMVHLANLSERFETLVLAMDNEALHKALDFSGKLSWIRAELQVAKLPKGRKDPGELSPRQVLTTYARF